jgi:hypothetical protein
MHRSLAALVVVAVTLSSCAVAPASTSFSERAASSESHRASAAQASEPSIAERSIGDDPVEHVIVISVDGLASRAVQELGPAGAPTLFRMAQEGASTLNARNMPDNTTTLPNHMSMVTGRPVLGSSGHRVATNEDDGQTVHREAGTYVESIFGVVHDHGGTTALFTTKAKFDVINRSWDSTNGGVDTVAPDDGRDKIDRYYRGEDEDAVDELLSLMRRGAPTLALLHLGSPDKNGHDFGWMSQSYLDAVTESDERIGLILNQIVADPQQRGSFVVLVTADHGGEGFAHVDASDARTYTVPFVAWGGHIKPGADLYELNSTSRTDPGDGRPELGDAAPIWNADVANLTADLLGLPALEGSVFNIDQTLRLWM